MPTIIATAGASNANSYLTVAEAQAYFDARTPVAGWENADPNQEALLIMATRTIDMMFAGARVAMGDGNYRIGPMWTGVPTLSTQALAWPRTGMFNRNGFPIDPMAIPQDLKNAVAELAGSLGTADRLVDNDIAIQGITSVKAGSVALSFDQSKLVTTKILPDAVMMFLVPSWLTSERIEGSVTPMFDVL